MHATGHERKVFIRRYLAPSMVVVLNDRKLGLQGNAEMVYGMLNAKKD
jgi:hypothetical protein